jgi:actin-binding LIM protein
VNLIAFKLGTSSPAYLERPESNLNDLSRVYTYSYITAEPNQGYLRKPLEPRPPKSPQFHRPPGLIMRSALLIELNDCCLDGMTRKRVFYKPLPKQGMQVMVEHLQTASPRPKSPSMNNEEPIELAHYPGATKPGPDDVARIDRPDFPAPPVRLQCFVKFYMS